MDKKTEEPEQKPKDILGSIVPKEKREAIGRDCKMDCNWDRHSYTHGTAVHLEYGIYQNPIFPFRKPLLSAK